MRICDLPGKDFTLLQKSHANVHKEIYSTVNFSLILYAYEYG